MPLVGIYWSIYVILIWFKRSRLILTDICNGLITPDIWKHIWSEYVSIYRPILYYIDRYMKISIFYMIFRPIYAKISKIKICIYRSKNEKFRHISIKITFLKKLHISVNIRLSYIGQYNIFNIDRYMLTYSVKLLVTFCYSVCEFQLDYLT